MKWNCHAFVFLLFVAVFPLFAGCVGGGAVARGDGNAVGGNGLNLNVTAIRQGTLNVENPFPVPVYVVIDGTARGALYPGYHNSFPVVAGSHHVVLLNQFRQVLSESDESTD